MKKLLYLVLGAWIVGGSACAAYGSSYETSSFETSIDTAFATHQFREVVMSPNGRRVAWIESWPLDQRSYQAHLFVEEIASHRIRPVGASLSVRVSGIAWSPDSEQLAFLTEDTKDGHASLRVENEVDGAVRVLAPLAGECGTPKWSHQGDEIALLVKAPASEQGARVGAWAQRDLTPQKLVIVNVANGTKSPAGPDDLFIYEFDWSPDGKHFAVTAATGDGNDNWWYARLYRIDRLTQAAVELVKPELQVAVPRWSPDGKSIAYVSGLMSDFIAPGGDIAVVSSGGGAVTDVTPSLTGSATWLAWRGAHTLLFTEQLDGHSAVATVDTITKQTVVGWQGPESLSTGGLESALTVSADAGTSAAIRQSFSAAPEIWAGAVGSWTQVSEVNAGMKAGWGHAESLHWVSEGKSIQGWIVYPLAYDATKTYPMVVLVHGGPAGDSQAKWAKPFYDMEALSAKGYFVFYPNARGSLGFGEAFTQANVRDLGFGDFRDITSGVNAVLARLPVARARVGITGWSYGGYMAMWAGTQTDTFHAAVAGPGTSNWKSYYGQVDIEKWLLPYFKATVYEDPEIYERSSPINYVKNAETPTFMFAGEIDGVCPAAQSYELWRALGSKGVPTDLVVYPGETHGMVIPANQRAATEAAAAWFDKYLAAGH